VIETGDGWPLPQPAKKRGAIGLIAASVEVSLPSNESDLAGDSKISGPPEEKLVGAIIFAVARFDSAALGSFRTYVGLLRYK